MATEPLPIDAKALLGASRADLIALAKNISKAKETATHFGPQTDDELHAFILEKWGINVPRVAVTPGFDAPFDYVADIYFERVESALIVGGRETAKCVAAGTRVVDAATGKLWKIEEIVEKQIQISVNTIDQGTGKILAVPVYEAIDSGTKNCLRITTASGRQIVTTPEHPYLLPHGWQRAENLSIGDTVAIPNRVISKSDSPLPDHHIDLLAVVLAEGGITSKSSVIVSTADPVILELVTRAANEIDCDVRHSSRYDYRIKKRSGKENPARSMLTHYGVKNEYATEKTIPAEIFSAPIEQIERFLSIFWMCDGYVDRIAPGMTLASEEMLRQIQHLLLRLNIQSSIKPYTATNGGDEFPAWRLTVYADSFERFAECMSLWGHKRIALDRIIDRPRQPKRGRPPLTDDLMAIIKSELPAIQKGRQLTNRSAIVNEHMGWKGNKKAGVNVLTVGGVKTLQRRRLRAMCAANEIDTAKFDCLLSDDLWWDPIVSIEEVGEHHVYDLCVPPHSNFIANDIVAHNTMNVALINALNAIFKPGYWAISAGAIDEQSRNAYKALMEILRNWGSELVKGASLQSKTEFKNRSLVEVKGGTRSQLNGPHSNSLHRDEIELFDRAAFDEGDNITKSGVTTDGREIKAVDILTTSRKFAKGLLQELLDECDKAIKAGRKPPHRVYKVGVAETVKRVPNCRGLPENQGKPDSELCDCNQMFKGTWDDGTDRTLEQVCDGRFGRSDGWRPLDPDIKKKFLTNSRFMWEAQQECMRPAGEGLILASFKEAVHVISSYEPNPEYGRIYQSTDFGGGNPHAANWYQHITVPVTVKDFYGDDKTLPAGSLVCFAEVYVTEVGNMDLAAMIVAMEEKFKAIYGPGWEVEERYADVANRAARIDFRNYDPPLRTTWRVTREIEEHITKCQGIVNDKSFYVLKGGEDGSGCPMFIDEANSWQRDPATGKQIDTFNHCFPAGTYVTTPFGRQKIEDIFAGDLVLTSQGIREVLASGVSGLGQNVYEIKLDDGSSVRATADHPIWVDGRGWVQVSDIRYADRLWKLHPNHSDEELRKSLSSEACGSAVTRTQTTIRRAFTTGRGFRKRISEWNLSIERFGKQRTDPSQTDSTSTTRTRTRSTTTSTTSNACLQRNTLKPIEGSRALSAGGNILIECAQKTSRRTFSIPKFVPKLLKATRSSMRHSKLGRLFGRASNAHANSTTVRSTDGRDFAAMRASQRTVERQGSTMRFADALSAAGTSQSTGIPRSSHALVRVVSISRVSNENVYDLTVEGAHEFYADGIRVHNCMSNFRYAVANIDRKLQIEKRKGIGSTTQAVAAEEPTGPVNLTPGSDLPNTGPVSTNYNDDQEPFGIPLHQHGPDNMDNMW